jgi:hypothetical protein
MCCEGRAGRGWNLAGRFGKFGETDRTDYHAIKIRGSMWLVIGIVSFPLLTAIALFVSAKLTMDKPLYGVAAKLDPKKCPLCHKIQDPIVPGAYTCPQCKSDLIIKDDLVVQFLPKENQKADLSVLKPFLWLLIIAILPIYYVGSGITYGTRNVMLFFSSFSFYVARLGLKYGVVAARFGGIYRAETPRAFSLTVAIWYAMSVMFAYLFILDVWKC